MWLALILISPIFISPNINVAINTKPRSLDFGEKTHHAITLHIWLRVIELIYNNQMEVLTKISYVQSVPQVQEGEVSD